MGFCPQGRRATGYAIASVLRFAPHWAIAHPPHASRKRSLQEISEIIVSLCVMQSFSL
ncbi:MAG: hypothetical protein NZ455_15165 [Bacteroidia bacterium]|nr:hypothetical protein [Bacteroidia bacterium]